MGCINCNKTKKENDFLYNKILEKTKSGILTGKELEEYRKIICKSCVFYRNEYNLIFCEKENLIMDINIKNINYECIVKKW